MFRRCRRHWANHGHCARIRGQCTAVRHLNDLVVIRRCQSARLIGLELYRRSRYLRCAGYVECDHILRGLSLTPCMSITSYHFFTTPVSCCGLETIASPRRIVTIRRAMAVQVERDACAGGHQGGGRIRSPSRSSRPGRADGLSQSAIMGSIHDSRGVTLQSACPRQRRFRRCWRQAEALRQVVAHIAGERAAGISIQLSFVSSDVAPPQSPHPRR